MAATAATASAEPGSNSRWTTPPPRLRSSRPAGSPSCPRSTTSRSSSRAPSPRGRRHLRSVATATFPSTTRSGTHRSRSSRWRSTARPSSRRTNEAISTPDRALTVSRHSRAADGTVLAEHEAKGVLEVRHSRRPYELVSSAEAVEAANRFDGLAMKIVSPQIQHKTEAGGVALGVSGESDVRDTYEELVANAEAYDSEATIDGVLISPMLGGRRGDHRRHTGRRGRAGRHVRSRRHLRRSSRGRHVRWRSADRTRRPPDDRGNRRQGDPRGRETTRRSTRTHSSTCSSTSRNWSPRTHEFRNWTSTRSSVTRTVCR
ncbi:hypothetical protein D8S78_23535 [Natrialba swarupiae]|nr:hypothetical protein [Natrialba swarupiae]